jgi:hypothetical protein
MNDSFAAGIEIQMNPIHLYCDEQYDIATQANLHIFEQLL